MKRLLLLVVLAMAGGAAFTQSTPTFCQFAAPGVMTCNTPQGLPTVQQPLPSSPGPAIRPIPPPQPYSPPPTSSYVAPRLTPPPEVATVARLPAPDDTDLKSAYCVGEISESNREMSALMGSHVTVKSDAEQQALDHDNEMGRQILQTQGAKVERLQTYLSPRLHAVDNGMLLAAWKQGQVDASNIDAETKTCLPQCNASDAHAQTQCVMACNENSEAYQHSKMCQALPFLPY